MAKSLLESKKPESDSVKKEPLPQIKVQLERWAQFCFELGKSGATLPDNLVTTAFEELIEKLFAIEMVRDSLLGSTSGLKNQVATDRAKKSQNDGWRTPKGERLRDLPFEYAECYRALVELSHDFRQEVADVLQPRLNRQLQTMAQDTYEEKRLLASWVNNELHQIGLAIKCPKTGKPATLVADIRGGRTDSSRFRLDVRNDDGRHIRTVTVNQLPELELIEDEPRREGLARPRGRGA
jgi:hypothetical protein